MTLHNPERRYLRRSALFAAFALVVSILPFDFAGVRLPQAEAGPSTVETYLIPLPEEDIRGGSLALYSGTSDTVHTIISITGAVDGTIVYYDHWEDGFELDLANPAQATTEIWGDGIAANGAPPGCLADGCDTFGAGDNAALINDVFANPRNPVDVFYDGGDQVGATAPVAVTRAGWALDPGTLLAGAVEVYPTDAWDTFYELPMGENSSLGQNVEYTAASIMAAANGTTVTIDVDADTIVDQTHVLGAGESVLVGGLDESATITATGPIQVDLLTGDVGATYAGRWFALLPTSQWATSYFNPVGTSGADGPSYAVLYNPGTATLTVDVDYQGGATTVDVAPGDVATYTMPASGARFSAGSAFYATVVVDYDDTASDWGFTLVPETRLTTAAVVGWGPGSNDPPTENSSPVWVTAEGATTLYVDYDGDPTTGPNVDTNGDQYDVALPVVAYQMERLYDGSDNDQTGLKVYTLDGTRIAVAYGQDAATASPGSPALDLGTAVVPLLLVAMGKIGSLSGDTNGNGALDPGEFITYTVTIRNDGTADINPSQFTDALDPNTTYVPGTTTVDGVGYADAGTTPFPFDEGGQDLGLITPGQVVVISYDVQLNDPLPEGINSIVNNAQLNSIGISIEGSSIHPVFDPFLEVAKTSDVSATGAIPGDTITYTIVVENTSDTPQNGFTILDTVPPGTTYVAESTSVSGPVGATATYADNAENGGYGGSVGSLFWGPDWTEVNESDGPNSGDEQVVNSGGSLRFRVRDNDSGGEGLSRAVNLAGYDTASISFDFARSGFDNANDFVVLEATDGVGGWDEIAKWEGPGSDPVFLPASFSLDSYLTAGAAIRFMTSPNLGSSDIFLFDNVVISAATVGSEVRTNAAGDPSPLQDGTAPNLVVPADPFSLDPGATMTITYEVEVANPLVPAITDFTNTVYVASEQQPIFTTDSVTDPVAYPEITLAKTLLSNADEDASGDVTVDDTLTYQFVATNTGDTDLSDVTITDPFAGLSALSCSPVQPATLAIGQTLTCSATYTVTQADVNASRIDNTATATALDPAGRPVSDEASETVPINPAPAVTLAKSLLTNLAGIIAGDTLDYEFMVINTGNVDLASVVVSDPLVGGVVSCPQNLLAPNETMTCTAAYTVAQGDIDAGQVANTATVTADDPGGNPVTDEDDELAILEQNPSIDLAKALQSNADEDGSGGVSLGDTLTYEFVATNDGNVTLNNVAVSDPLPGLSVLSCAPASGSSLAPDDQMICSATYMVTQSDVDAGAIDNTAAVTGTSVGGTDVTDTSSESVSAAQNPSITLSKSFIANADEDLSGDVSLSDTLTYQFDVVNDGDVTLTVVTLTDPLPGLSAFSCGLDVLPVTLTPGATVSCTATYVVMQSDVDAGRIDNTATASGLQPNGLPISDDDDETVLPDRNPSIDLAKTFAANADEDGSGDVSLDDTLTYQFVATNDGDVGLDSVTVTDPLGGLSALSCAPAAGSSLAPTESMTCTATYVVTQADIDAGEVENTATATGDDSGGGGAVTDQDSVTVSTAQNPSIGIVKSLLANADEDGSGDVSLDDTLTYELIVTNHGDVTLANVAVDDPLTGGPVTCPQATLAPTETMTCTTTYVVMQADIDAGFISNTATVAADDPQGNPVADSDDELVAPPQNPSIVLIKTLGANSDDDGSGDLSAGDTITYEFLATNDGDVTLSLVTVTDPLPGLSGLTCAPAAGSSLATGASMACSATYPITQGDVDAGSIDNTATVVAERPGGDPGDPGDDVTDFDNHSVLIPAEPAIAVTKTMAANADEDGSGDVSVGDTLSYEFLVENMGNVTLSSVGVADPLVGPVSCPVTVLAPAGSTTCAAGYVVSQADADAGWVINTANASGTDPHGTTVTDEDAVATPVVADPAIDLTKTLVFNADEDGSGGISIADTLTYSFVATNSGEVTLSGVTVADPLPGLSALSCNPAQPAVLAPGDVVTCTAVYSVTQTNVDQGQILNTATASGLAPDSTLVSDSDDEGVLIAQNPSIALDKFVAGNADEDGSGGVTRDDTLTYQFEATNTGNVTLTAAAISDPLPGLGALSCVPAQPTTLLPGETIVCTADYVVVQSDVDAGAATNTATVNALDPDSAPVSDNDAVVTPIEGSPTITLDKFLAGNADEDGTGDVSRGDTLTYQFDVENLGDVTLTAVTVSDPLPGLGAITCVPAQGSTLLPAQTMSCTASYTVTAADTAVGQIDNTATVVGLAPAGTPTSTDDSETVLTARADLALFKSVSDPTPNVGDSVTFILSVVNDGPDTATNIDVADALPAGYAYEAGSIAGGDSRDDSGAPSLTWTIDAIGGGASVNLTFSALVLAPSGGPDEYRNVAEVSDTDTLDPDSSPGNDDGDQSEDDEDSAVVVPQVADLSLAKNVSDTTPDVGDTVTFTVTVSNTGPSAASGVAVRDLLPDGYSSVTNVSHSGIVAGALITWSGLSVASGGSVDLTFEAVVEAPAADFANVAEVTASDQFDPDSVPDNDDGDQSEDDEDSASLVPRQADLSLAKSVSDATPNVGDTVTFTITVSNSGPDEATGVAVEDVVPAGFSGIGSISAGGVLAGSAITWSGLSVASGGSAVLTFDAAVEAPTPAAGEYDNVAQVVASSTVDPDSAPNNDDGDQSEDDEDSAVVVPQVADLSLSKSVSDATPNVGDTVTFTISVANDGSDEATGVAVEDVVPAGFSGIGSISAGGVLAGSTITWSSLTIASGGSVDLTFEAVVEAPAADFTNVAEVTAVDQFDPDSAPNNDDGDQSEDDEDSAVVVPQVADLSLSKSVSDATPNVGDTVTFTITVSNTGPADATSVEVADLLPGGFAYQAGSMAGGVAQDDAAAPTLSWTVGTLGSGASVVLTFAAVVGAPGADHTNVAEVTAVDQFDPDSVPNNDDGDQSEDDEDSAAVVPRQADLSLAKAVSDPTPNAGDTVTFTITVSNAGPDGATGVAVEDVVPVGYGGISNISAGGVLAGSTITWSGLIVANGGSVDVTFDAVVEAPAADFSNVAEVTASDQFDADSTPGNDDGDQSEDDEDSAAVVPQVADLLLTKTVSDGAPNVGDTVTFTITVGNDGPDNATGVAVEDVVPAGYSGISNVSAGGVLVGSTITWSGLSVANGGSVDVTFDAVVEAPAADFANVVEVTASDQFDPDSAPNNDDGDQSEDDEDIAVVVPQQADLSLVKGVSDSAPLVDQTITFTITINNAGPDDATGVGVQDTVPNGYASIANISSGGAAIGNTITWTGLTVPAGGSTAVTFEATVQAPPAAYLNMTEVTAADQFDPDSTPDNDDGDQSEDDEDNVGLLPTEADLSLAKVVSDSTPNVGDTVTFTITVSNAGPDDATGVAVDDAIPAGFSGISGISAGGLLAGSTISWSGLAIPSAGSIDLTFDAVVEAPPAVFANVAEVTASDQFDPDSAPNNDDGDQSEDDEDSAVVEPQVADLSLAKTVSDSTPNVGDTVTFTISISNSGPDDATAVAVDDDIPAGYSGISAISAGGVLIGSTITWPGLVVPSGDAIDVTFDAVVGTPGADFANVAEVTASDQFDPDSAPNNDDGNQSEDDEDSAAVVPQQADLSIAKTVSAATPNVGDVVTFTLTVSNAGPDSATSVAVEDVVPAGYGGITNISSGGALAGNTVTWSGLTVADGGSVALTFDATVAAPPADYANVAEVTASDQFDPDSTPANDDGDQSEDDEGSAVVVPQQADLSLVKTLPDPDPHVGDVVTFTVTVTNSGPDDATGVAVDDAVPSGYSDISNVSAGGITTGPVISWSGLTVPNGESVDLTFDATVAAPPADYANVAEVTAADQFDPDSTPANDDGDQSEDDEDSAVATPQVADLDLLKAVDDPTPTVGAVVTFTVTVSNDGPTDATGVVVADELPAGLAGVAAISNSGVLAGATITWSGLTIAAGASMALTFEAVVAAPTGVADEYLNVAEVVASDQFDPDSTPGNDDGDQSEDDEANAELLPAIIGLAKSVGGVSNNGDGSYTVSYLLTVVNYGEVLISALQLSDDVASQLAALVPTGFDAGDGSLLSNANWDGTASSNILADGQSLAPGGSGTVQISVTVTPGAEVGPHDNVATVAGGTPSGGTVTDDSTDGIDPDADGDDDDGTVDDDDLPDEDTPTPVAFNEAPLLGVSKWLSSEPVDLGDGSFEIAYSIAVENLGDVDLATVQITEDLRATFISAEAWSVVSVSSPVLTVSTSFDGSVDTSLLVGNDALGVGESAPVEVVVLVSPGVELGPHWNSAVAAGVSPMGTTVGDVSQDGLDPDPDGNGDPGDNSDATPVVFPALGAVTGTVWADVDADATMGLAEIGLADVSVALVDPGPVDVVGGGDDVVIASISTDASGFYTFANVPRGDYFVVVDAATLPSEMLGTYDPDGTLDDMTAVAVVAGGTSADNDFGYVAGFNLWLTKTSAGGTRAGETVDYTITIGNDGPGTAFGPITVVDVVPASLPVTGVTAGGWDCSIVGQTVECVWDGDLAADATASIEVATVIAAGAAGDLPNTAEVESTGPVPEPDLTDNSDGATVSIGELPRTGADVLRFAILGLLLLAVGAALLTMERREGENRQ